MKNLLFAIAILTLSALVTSCKESNVQTVSPTLSHLDSLTIRDQMDFFVFNDILLGDGVPIGVKLAIRWKITEPELVLSQFNSIAEFRNNILKTRGRELMNEAFNEFESVDSVFSTQRQVFIGRIKEIIDNRLGEAGVVMKEVICEQIFFPKTYTTAMEQVGLQRQEMERINQATILAVAKAEADKKQAEANAKVDIAKAKAADQVEKIKGETEKSRRTSQLAAAETEKQIAYKKAQSEAERLELLAKTELVKRRDLKKLDIQHERDQIQLEVEKKKKIDMADFEVQMELAKVFQQNPIYASYLVNKEMASKVKIAVLPTGSDPNVFGNLLSQTIPVGSVKD